MIIINTVNNERFSLNGIEYFKNFLSFVAGDKVAIYNAYDKADQRIELALYSDFNVNGVIYGSASLLQAALLNVIYTRDTLGSVVNGLKGSITPTSTPTGTGVAFWFATQNGTYTNFGGVVVNTNSFAVISRDSAGAFSISQTAFDITSKVNVSDSLINNVIIGKNGEQTPVKKITINPPISVYFPSAVSDTRTVQTWYSGVTAKIINFLEVPVARPVFANTQFTDSLIVKIGINGVFTFTREITLAEINAGGYNSLTSASPMESFRFKFAIPVFEIKPSDVIYIGIMCKSATDKMSSSSVTTAVNEWAQLKTYRGVIDILTYTTPPTNAVANYTNYAMPVNFGFDDYTTTKIKAFGDLNYSPISVSNALPKTKDTTIEVSYPNKDFSLETLTVGDLVSAYYANFESKTLDYCNLKSFSIKSTGSGNVKIIAISIVGLVPTILHFYPDISVTTGINTYTVTDEFILPPNSYLAVNAPTLYYANDSADVQNSLRMSNATATAVTTTKVRLSYSFIVYATKNTSDLTTKTYVDNTFVSKFSDLNNFKFARRQKLLSTDKVILYGDSISSTDYTGYKTAMEDLTGATVYNGGFSGNTAAQLATNAKLQRIFDYNPNVIVCMLGGNDNGALGTVGTFTNINNEPIVSETSISADYNGTYYIQAISHTIRKIKAQYYNIRVRANLTGSETEAEKTAKIDAVIKPYFIFCTPIAQQRNNSTDPFSLFENNKRKRDAVVECCLKYDIPCVDLFYNTDIDMSLEPYWVSPTNMTDNRGIYTMDGLHPNKYGYRIIAEIVSSAINSK